MSFFVALGGGRFRATEHTVGPWDPRHQHAGPPSALLAGVIEACAPREELPLARITLEILGPIDVGEVEVEAAVERPGRSVEMIAGELRAGGRPVMRARAWRVLRAPVGVVSAHVPPPLPAEPQPPAPGFGAFGYVGAVELRWVEGAWLDPGPAKVWTRLRMPIVEGVEPTPLQRVVAVADSGNGVSAALDWTRYVFINPELSVHLLRPPVGEWVCLEARTEVEAVGLATSVLSDESGPVARGAQSLLVASR